MGQENRIEGKQKGIELYNQPMEEFFLPIQYDAKLLVLGHFSYSLRQRVRCARCIASENTSRMVAFFSPTSFRGMTSSHRGMTVIT